MAQDFIEFSHIYVHMNILQSILETINLIYRDSTWTQPLDYEHVMFKCRWCHEYGHMFQDTPLTITEEAHQAT